jgi:hypothetical protein
VGGRVGLREDFCKLEVYAGPVHDREDLVFPALAPAASTDHPCPNIKFSDRETDFLSAEAAAPQNVSTKLADTEKSTEGCEI